MLAKKKLLKYAKLQTLNKGQILGWFKYLNYERKKKEGIPWTQEVNWSFTRRSKDILGVSWTSDGR